MEKSSPLRILFPKKLLSPLRLINIIIIILISSPTYGPSIAIGILTGRKCIIIILNPKNERF